MLIVAPQQTAAEVLRAFRQDQPFLFLGSAFLTVAFVAIIFCLMRRRFNSLLVWMAVFAGLYGLRLWIQSRMLSIEFHGSLVFERFRMALSYLIPIPAFMFFQVAGFLGRRPILRGVGHAMNLVFALLFLMTLAFGPRHILDAINGIMVSVVLSILLVRSLGESASHDRDFAVVRFGVLFFVTFALWDNVVGELWIPSKIEPYGFAVLLACLGYVGARRTLARDVALGDIQAELELARRMQLSILPGDFHESSDFCVAARYMPMTAVAGDLYDYINAGERQAGLFIADVSGHGMPAALIASMVKMAAISQRDNAAHPAHLLTGMNIALCGNTQGQYVTAAYVHLNAETRQLRYAAAGHPPMLLLRGGTVIEIAENGLLLAASAEAEYTDRVCSLEIGDRLLLYTDGLVEARNSDGRMIGEESLVEILRDTGDMSPTEAADKLIASTQSWTKLQDDDWTVIVCDYKGAG